MNVSVIGLGKVGLPLVSVLAEKSNLVYALDFKKIISLIKIKIKQNDFSEPKLNEGLKRYKKKIIYSHDYLYTIKNTDITFIIVPTPSKSNGEFSIKYVEDVIINISKVLNILKKKHTLVLTSTVMPGQTDRIKDLIKKNTNKIDNSKIDLIYSPWFIALGNVINNLQKPDLFLIGESNKKSGLLIENFYKKFLNAKKNKIQRMNYINAEISKLSLNTYITTKISFANSIALLCENIPNADAEVVCKALGKDSRIGGRYLKGSIPYGGPCFPRDNKALKALGKKIKIKTRISDVTNQINNERIVDIFKLINRIKNTDNKISIFGLSYKEDTDVLEESFGINIANYLSRMKYKIAVYDKNIKKLDLKKMLDTKIKISNNFNENLNFSNFYIIALKSNDFKNFKIIKNYKKEQPIKILDCWGDLNLLSSQQIKYYKLGKFT